MGTLALCGFACREQAVKCRIVKGIVVPWCIYIAWRGLSCVAYPHQGAMLEPVVRDKRGETYSHVFFVSVSQIISIIYALSIESTGRGVAGQHTRVPL